MNIKTIFLVIFTTCVYKGHVFCSRISSHIIDSSSPVEYDYTDDFPFEADRYDRWPPPFYPESYSRYPRELQELERDTREITEAISDRIWSRLFNRLNIFELLRSFSSPRKSRSVKTYRKKFGKKSGRRRHHRIHRKGKIRPRRSGIGHRPDHFAAQLYDEEYSQVPSEAGLVTRLQKLLRNTISETLTPVWSIYQRFPLTQSALLDPFFNRADFIYPDFSDNSSEEFDESRESKEYDGKKDIRESNESTGSINKSNTGGKNVNSSSKEDGLEVGHRFSTDSDKDINEANKGQAGGTKDIEGEEKKVEASIGETAKS